MKTFTFKAVPILFLLLFSFTGCKKKDKAKPEPQEAGTIFTLIDPSGTPGDLIRVTTDEKFEADTAEISIGGQPAILYRINDTTAAFRLPVLSPGKVNIDLSKTGAGKTLSFIIGHYTPITQPDAVKKEFTDGIDEFLTWTDTLEDQSMVPTIKGLQEVFLSEYEKLTDQEKLQAAYVLQKLHVQAPGIERKANPAFFPMESIQKGWIDAFGKKIDALSKSYTAKVIATVALITTGGVLAWKGKGKERVIGAGIAVAGLCMLKSLLKTEDNLLSSAFEPFTAMLSNLRKSSSYDRKIPGDTSGSSLYRAYDMVFLPGKAVNKKITAQFRSISQANRNQSPFYKDLFQKYDQTTIAYLAIKTGVEKIRSWSSIIASIVPDIPERETAIPENPKTETGTMPAEAFSIENISDPDITLKKEGEEVLSLTATGQNVNSTREFTFDLVFQNEKFGINYKKAIQAVYYGDGTPPESVAITTKDQVPAKISGISQSLQLEVSVLPADAKQEVVWSIVNGAEHAEVDATGKVTSLSGGTVTIRAAAKANAEIYDDLEVTIEEGEGYVLEIGTMAVDENTSTEIFVPRFKIKQGERASISLPNYLMQPVRLTYNGQPVAYYRGSTVSYRLFQYNSTEPNSGAPIHIPDYPLVLKDEANAKEIEFHLDLTLTNEAYTAIVGKTLKITRRPWRIQKVEVLLLTVNSDGTYTIVDQGTGATKFSGKYHWSGSYINPYSPCGTTYSDFHYIKRPPGIGRIDLDVPDSWYVLEWITINEGGDTYRAYYDCPTDIDDYESDYIKVEKYNE